MCDSFLSCFNGSRVSDNEGDFPESILDSTVNFTRNEFTDDDDDEDEEYDDEYDDEGEDDIHGDQIEGEDCLDDLFPPTNHINNRIFSRKNNPSSITPIQQQQQQQRHRKTSLIDTRSFDFIDSASTSHSLTPTNSRSSTPNMTSLSTSTVPSPKIPQSLQQPFPNSEGGMDFNVDHSKPLPPRKKRGSITAWIANSFSSITSSTKGTSASSKSSLMSNGSSSSISHSTNPSSPNANRTPVTIAMYGTGESGKSTILKQMKVIHQGGFSTEELESYKADIYRNIHESIILLLDTIDYTELTQDPETLDSVKIVRFFKPVYSELAYLPSEYVGAVNFLWIELIRARYDIICRKNYILDSAPYFLDAIFRIGNENYVPTNNDVLHARLTTSGISEYNFIASDLAVKMFDVGGQRPERKYWVETYNNVTTLIFCVSLSEYDQVLREDSRQNRLVESLQLWRNIINSSWFQRTSIVLFLNKKDLFRRKLRYHPLELFFPQFKKLQGKSITEDQSFEHSKNFILQQFLRLNYNRLPIYPYVTCATDTNNINCIFTAVVKETILANIMKNDSIF